MRRLWYIPLLLLLAATAQAQSPTEICLRTVNTPGLTNCVPIGSGTPLPVTGVMGASNARVQALATNNATLVAAGAGRVLAVHLSNSKASVVFFKLYNKATAPTCGTDTPVATFALAANGGRIDIESPGGSLAVALGLGYCIVTGAADTDNTAVGADEVHGYLAYR